MNIFRAGYAIWTTVGIMCFINCLKGLECSWITFWATYITLMFLLTAAYVIWIIDKTQNS